MIMVWVATVGTTIERERADQIKVADGHYCSHRELIQGVPVQTTR